MLKICAAALLASSLCIFSCSTPPRSVIVERGPGHAELEVSPGKSDLYELSILEIASRGVVEASSREWGWVNGVVAKIPVRIEITTLQNSESTVDANAGSARLRVILNYNSINNTSAADSRPARVDVRLGAEPLEVEIARRIAERVRS
ncbi:MAG: hypothetical protein ACKVS6_13710 [Planctomycetota bacterium]